MSKENKTMEEKIIDIKKNLDYITKNKHHIKELRDCFNDIIEHTLKITDRMNSTIRKRKETTELEQRIKESNTEV